MSGKLYLFTILALLVSSEAKKVKVLPSHPEILNLELNLNEDKIDDYIVDSFFATYDPQNNTLLHCDVSMSDILKAIPTKKLNIVDFIAATDKLNLFLNDSDISDFISSLNYEDLNSMGFTVGKTYKAILKTYFKGRTAELLQCLDILGITSEFATALAFGTDEDMFNSLQNANISYYNLVEIANIISVPVTIKDLSNILGLKKFNQLYLTNFVNTKVTPMLFGRGLTEQNLLDFLQSFGLSLNNYKDSKPLKNCINLLTKYKSLAVAVSENEVITNDDSLISKYLNLEKYTSLSAVVIEDTVTRYKISADNIMGNTSDNIIRIKIDTALASYVQETETYEDIQSKSCNYITMNENYDDDADNQLISQNVPANLVNDQLIVSKFYNTVFRRSSPLICEQKLYGLAAINRINDIVFDYFEDRQKQDLPAIFDDPKLLDAIKEFFQNVIGNSDPCKGNPCSNKDKEHANESQEENTNELNTEISVESDNELIPQNEEHFVSDSNEVDSDANEHDNVESVQIEENETNIEILTESDHKQEAETDGENVDMLQADNGNTDENNKDTTENVEEEENKTNIEGSTETENVDISHSNEADSGNTVANDEETAQSDQTEENKTNIEVSTGTVHKQEAETDGEIADISPSNEADSGNTDENNQETAQNEQTEENTINIEILTETELKLESDTDSEDVDISQSIEVDSGNTDKGTQENAGDDQTEENKTNTEVSIETDHMEETETDAEIVDILDSNEADNENTDANNQENTERDQIEDSVSSETGEMQEIGINDENEAQENEEHATTKQSDLENTSNEQIMESLNEQQDEQLENSSNSISNETGESTSGEAIIEDIKEEQTEERESAEQMHPGFHDEPTVNTSGYDSISSSENSNEEIVTVNSKEIYHTNGNGHIVHKIPHTSYQTEYHNEDKFHNPATNGGSLH